MLQLIDISLKRGSNQLFEHLTCTIHPGHKVGMVADGISRVDDQHVGIVYEGSQADLVFERLSLDELLAKE